MTKQPSAESALKCHLAMDEAKKVVESNALVVCGAPVIPELEDALDVTSIGTGVKSETSRLGKVMRELYNLEDCVKSEKPVKIDLGLDLYQMEKV